MTESATITSRFHRTMRILLVAGLVVRLTVLRTSAGFNPDPHYQVIQYIVEHRALPISNVLIESQHPPLYYLLAAAIYAPFRTWPPVHFLSFVLSCANLLLIYRLLSRGVRDLIRSDVFRAIAFGFACVLPQFVMNSDFISNDTLSMLIGTLCFAAAVRYLRSPDVRGRAWLAVSIGAALMTKGTFLLTGPAMTLIVALVEWRIDRQFKRVAIATSLFVAIWAGLGCDKYVENLRYFGRATVNFQDVDNEYSRMQRGAWKGWRSAYDVNVIKLIRWPILKISDPSSIPLMFYATFWYPHIPDSSFQGNIVGYAWLGSAIYAIAIVPTALFLIGLARATALTARFAIGRTVDLRSQIAAVALGMFLANAIIPLVAGLKYDVWVFFQSRLFMPALLPIACLAGLGWDVATRDRRAARTIGVICWIVIAMCATYFAIEVALEYGLLRPGQRVLP